MHGRHRAGDHDALPGSSRRCPHKRFQKRAAIFAATRGGQDDRTRPILQGERRPADVTSPFRLLAIDHIAAKAGAFNDGRGKVIFGNRIEDRAMAVHKNQVVEFRNGCLQILRRPFLKHGLALVENVPQSQDRVTAVGSHLFQSGLEFTAGAQGMFVHQDHRGAIGFHRGQEQGGTQGANLRSRDAQAPRDVMVVGDLAEAGQLDDFDIVRQAEAMHVIRAAHQQYRSLGSQLG